MLAKLVLLAALCAGLPGSRAQIAPAQLAAKGLCHVSPQLVRVLPSAGFSRSILAGYNTTTLSGGALIPGVSNLSDCLFLSYDPEFDELLGSNQTVYQVGPLRPNAWAVESPTWLPGTDEIVFSSWPTKTPSNFSRLSLQTGQTSFISINPPVGNTGGSTPYQGQVAVCTEGEQLSSANPPGVFLIDPYTGNSTALLNNFFGLRFNGFDDLVELNGSFIITDNNASALQNFANPPILRSNVWILPPTGPPRVLIADLPGQPNGIALTSDKRTLYITVFPLTPNDPYAAANNNQIYAFDLVNIQGGSFATGRRVFAVSDHGYVDGITVDDQGRVYATTDDGISVFNAGGTLIGKIQPDIVFPIDEHPTNSVGFAGNRLLMLRNADVLMLPLNTTSSNI